MSNQPSDSLVSWTHAIYALHAFSLLTGIVGAATVFGAFLTGWPSIIAVILNYVKRSEVRGTWLETHFQWQIRTFWFGLLWISLCFLFVIMTLGIGILIAWLPMVGVGLWFIYRILRGWLALNDRRPNVLMKRYVALFRGINVVGSHTLSMSDLKLLLESNGCCDVRTYIRSGNAIFRSGVADTGRLAKRLTSAVSKGHGFEPKVMVLTPAALQRAAARNPFPEATENPTSLHLFFLADRPKRPDLRALDTFKARSERYELNGQVLYLHTPDGFGTSKLAGRIEKFLGVAATARNWRTVTALVEMART